MDEKVEYISYTEYRKRTKRFDSSKIRELFSKTGKEFTFFDYDDIGLTIVWLEDEDLILDIEIDHYRIDDKVMIRDPFRSYGRYVNIYTLLNDLTL